MAGAAQSEAASAKPDSAPLTLASIISRVFEFTTVSLSFGVCGDVAVK